MEGGQRLRRRDRHRPGGGPRPSPAPAAWAETPSPSSTTPPRGAPTPSTAAVSRPGATSRERFTSRGLTTMPLERPGLRLRPGRPGRLLDAAPALRLPPLAAPLRAGHPLRRGRAGRLPPPAPHHLRLQSQAGAVRLLRRRLLPRRRAPCRGQPLPPPGLRRAPCACWPRGAPDAYYRGPIAAEIVRYSQEQGGLFSAEDFAAHAHGGLRAHAHHLPRGGGVRDGAPLAGPDRAGDAEHPGGLRPRRGRVRDAGDDAPDGGGQEAGLRRPPALRRRPPLRGRPPARSCWTRASPPAGGGRSTPSGPPGTWPGPCPRTLHGDTSSFCRRRRPGQRRLLHPLPLRRLRQRRRGRRDRDHPQQPRRAGLHPGGGAPQRDRRGQADDAHPQLLPPAARRRPLRRGRHAGGDMQPQWNVQTITNLVDFGMGPQQAVEAPRWYAFPGTDPEHAGKPQEVRLEFALRPHPGGGPGPARAPGRRPRPLERGRLPADPASAGSRHGSGRRGRARGRGRPPAGRRWPWASKSQVPVPRSEGGTAGAGTDPRPGRSLCSGGR